MILLPSLSLVTMPSRSSLKRGQSFKRGFVDTCLPDFRFLLSTKIQMEAFLSLLLCITAENLAIGLVAYNQSPQPTRVPRAAGLNR